MWLVGGSAITGEPGLEIPLVLPLVFSTIMTDHSICNACVATKGKRFWWFDVGFV
jgi:hypothetical protein